MKHYGDITKINGYDIPFVDVTCGGSPCQDLSVAGKRAGLAGERSGLFMEQIRIIKEMRENARQHGYTAGSVGRYAIWENVPGCQSSNSGRDFQAVLTEFVRVAEPNAPDVPMPNKGKWPRAGYLFGVGADGNPFSLAWRQHDAQWWGVPQRRKRLCVLCDYAGYTAAEILFDPQYWGETENGGQHEAESDPREEPASEVQSLAEGLPRNPAPRGTEAEGTPTDTEDGTYPSVANTLTRRNDGSPDPTKQHGASIVATTGITDYTAIAVGTNWDGTQTAPTLTSNNAGGNQRMPDKDNFNCVITYGLDRAAYNQGKNAKYDFSVEEELIGAQTARGPGAVCNSVVRRLTPLEAERLQGFPDGWTDLGEWVDSTGRVHKDADSPRYKALGNSIALPFWRWLARRICAQYERPVTMGSLFDGIGGFPLAFSECGAIPVWASEIEEFPIAVTKKHFPE